LRGGGRSAEKEGERAGSNENDPKATTIKTRNLAHHISRRPGLLERSRGLD